MCVSVCVVLFVLMFIWMDARRRVRLSERSYRIKLN